MIPRVRNRLPCRTWRKVPGKESAIVKTSVFKSPRIRFLLGLFDGPGKSIRIMTFFYFLGAMVSITFSQAALALALVFWAADCIKRKERPRFPAFFWPLLVYAAWSLVSAARSVNPEISFVDSRDLLLFLVVPILYTGFRSLDQVLPAAAALLVSAGTSSLYSLLLLLSGTGPGDRITGFMGHWMTQAGLHLLFCCLALSLFLGPRERMRILWGAAFLFSAFALAVTLTRSAWLGLAVGVAVVIALSRPKALLLVPVAFALFFFLSPRPIKSRFFSIFSLRNPSNAQRIEYLETGIRIIREYPVFGTGPDTVDMVFQNPKYGLSELAKRNVHLHNNLTQIGAERGLPGIVLWLAFMAWAFFSLVRRLKDKKSPSRPLVLGALAALVAFSAAGLFEYNFGDSEVTTLLLAILTLALVPEKGEKSSGDAG